MGKPRRLPFDKLFWDAYDNEPTLRLCSWAAQGVWPRLLRIMWFSPERGYLLDTKGQPPTVADLAELWGKPPESIPPLLCELEARGVFSRDERGRIYCRRMERDEVARRAAKAADEPTPTDRQVADMAVQAAIATLNEDNHRKALGRKRSARYRSKQRAKKTLDSLRAYAAMEVAASRADGVTGSVTVTSPASRVTSPIPGEIIDLRPVRPEIESESESRVTDGGSQPASRSLAPLTGVERDGPAEGFEGLRSVADQWRRRA